MNSTKQPISPGTETSSIWVQPLAVDRDVTHATVKFYFVFLENMYHCVVGKISNKATHPSTSRIRVTQ